MTSLKLLIAGCKRICNKMLREKCCLLMQPHHNHTQYICAGKSTPSSLSHLSYSNESALSVCLCVCVSALYPAFTYELQYNMPNMP